MKRFLITLLIVLLPPLTLAASYEMGELPYSDSAPDSESALAVSTLTAEGVLKGNPDGTYGWNDALNRAAFVTIVMRLSGEELTQVHASCFPDVPRDIWYASAVCAAKAKGIVRGNADPSKSENQWLFAPERPVQYEEAVKILVELYDIETQSVGSEEWYAPYVRAAEERRVAVPSLFAGKKITRSEMARLTARFLVESRGELEVFEEAITVAKMKGNDTKDADLTEEEKTSSSQSNDQTREEYGKQVEIEGKTYIVFPVGEDGAPISSNADWNSCIRGYSPLNKDGKPLNCLRIFDTEGVTWNHPDLNIRFSWNVGVGRIQLPDGYITKEESEKRSPPSKVIDLGMESGKQFVLYGSELPVMAKSALRMLHVEQSSHPVDYGFGETREKPSEPIITTVKISGNSKNKGVLPSVEVYRDNGQLLGTAHLKDDTYVLPLSIDQQVTLDEIGEEFSVYIKGHLKEYNEKSSQEASSNQPKVIAPFIQFLGKDERPLYFDPRSIISNDARIIYYVARSYISSIVNNDEPQQDLTPGYNKPLGSFTFHTKMGNDKSNVELQGLVFSIEGINPPEISNARLYPEKADEYYSCTVIENIRIECKNIPEHLGKIMDNRTYELRADISANYKSGSTLQIALGPYRKNGANYSEFPINWNDGTFNFSETYLGVNVIYGPLFSDGK